jgi:hypothetical protein
MMYAVNPYTGLSNQQHQNFPLWPYPLSKPASSFSDVENVTATSPNSRQQKIACGVGPASPPQRSFPADVRILGGSEAVPNSWPFLVSFSMKISDVWNYIIIELVCC